jgi:hypothetical protein
MGGSVEQAVEENRSLLAGEMSRASQFTAGMPKAFDWSTRVSLAYGRHWPPFSLLVR